MQMTKFFIIAAALVIAGLILFTVVFMANGWNFSRMFSSTTFETTTYQITDPFQNIDIKGTATDLIFLPADDGQCRVVCCEDPDQPYTVAVENGTLTITQDDNRSWHDRITLGSFEIPRITVSLPEAQYGRLYIKETTGDITIPAGFRFDSAEVSVTTGDISFCGDVTESLSLHAITGDIRVTEASAAAVAVSVTTGDVAVSESTCTGTLSVHFGSGEAILNNVSCGDLSAQGTTGDLELESVIAAGTIFAKTTTGDVELDGCDGGALSLQTTTGDVTGSLLTEKVFQPHTTTGNIRVPYTQSGGTCEITCTTGDISIQIVSP